MSSGSSLPNMEGASQAKIFTQKHKPATGKRSKSQIGRARGEGTTMHDLDIMRPTSVDEANQFETRVPRIPRISPYASLFCHSCKIANRPSSIFEKKVKELKKSVRIHTTCVTHHPILYNIHPLCIFAHSLLWCFSIQKQRNCKNEASFLYVRKTNV